MTELEFLKDVASRRTVGPYTLDMSGGIYAGDGQLFANCYNFWDLGQHRKNAAFFSLVGTVFDDVMRVLEAANSIANYADHERPPLLWDRLDNTLASLKESIRAARGEG